MIWRYVMFLGMTGFVAACDQPAVQLQIPFEAAYGESNLACGEDAGVNLTDLRFYVHDIRLLDSAGHAHPMQLEQTAWQHQNLALLDLENGSASCQNGTSETHSSIEGSIAGADFQALEFTLGVPFEKNHADPLSATPPLGDPDMHWHWRGGYKFLRAGVTSSTDRFWLHLGSTGCEGTIQDIKSCNAANRVTIRIADFTPGQAVIVDLAQLVSDGAMQDGIPGDCSSGPAESTCTHAFAALGLVHATGSVAGEQRIFSAGR